MIMSIPKFVHISLMAFFLIETPGLHLSGSNTAAEPPAYPGTPTKRTKEQRAPAAKESSKGSLPR